jgi:hypothetical protein
MKIKRIATIAFILLSYIALAGAMQNLLNRPTPAKPATPYAELRIDSARHVQVLICRDWVINPEDMDTPDPSTVAETGQDIFYWINLVDGVSQSELFTNVDVHANGPTPQRIYQGVIHWEHDQKTITITLHRTSPSDMPFGANGTYMIRKITMAPFMKDISN